MPRKAAVFGPEFTKLEKVEHGQCFTDGAGSNQAQEIICSQAFRGDADLTSSEPVLKVWVRKRKSRKRLSPEDF